MIITENNLVNKKVTVLGMKKSGYSAALLASNLGANVLVSDINSNKTIQYNYKKLTEFGISCEFGGHSKCIFNSDFWVVSPGIPKNIDIIKKAQSMKIPIFGEIEFASRLTKLPIIAVTGSNGKTTTVKIIKEMLKTKDLKPILAGNVGNPFSKSVLKLSQNSNYGNIFILEISSFQLEFIDLFRPYISLYLNITPDHLDRHKNMNEYFKTKLKMIKNINQNDFLIYNKDDELLNKSFDKVIAKKIPYSLHEKNKFFSVNSTKIYDENFTPLISLNDILLNGDHNLSNLLAAAIVARVLKVKNSNIKNTMKKFSGVKHRLQVIKTLNKITYINDSKATNISSVIAAINSFKEPIILLLGGKNKDSDFRQLLPHTKRHVKHIVSFGEAGGEIATAIGDAVRLNVKGSLNQAVASAHKIAMPGDIILLSPGCASFDEFDDYKQRGNFFINMVNKLNL